MHKVKIIKQMYADVQHVCMIKKKVWIIEIKPLNLFNLQNVQPHIMEQRDTNGDFR